MRVFSASIESFLSRLMVMTKTILREDFRVSVSRTRFQTADGWRWPISLVAIDHPRQLGYFDPKDLSIGVHKRLMYTAKDRVLKDLLRHELAHYFTYIKHHADASDASDASTEAEDRPHGAHFQSVCAAFGLSSEVRRASIDVIAENEAIAGELGNEAIIARFQKLMSLANSDNENEAALAVVRANELMLRHNLDATAAQVGRSGASVQNEIEYCVRLVLPYKRSSPRASAIAEILSQFLVYPVHASEGLEVTGTRANVEQAEYVAQYLNRALAEAWRRARRAHPNKKLRQKPFMAAAAESYLEKLRQTQNRMTTADQNALVVLNAELRWAGHGAYGGTVHTTSTSYRTCGVSKEQGRRAGAALEIRRGITSQGTVKLLG